MSRASIQRELKSILATAREAGWAVEKTKSCHWRLTSPDRQVPMIHIGSTLSDHRALANIRARLRRSGLDI